MALFVDEKAYAKTQYGDIVPLTARAIGLVGAPYDTYLASDFEAVYRDYRACIFMKPTDTECLTEGIRKATAAGKAVKVVTNDDRPVQTEVLQAFLKDAGVTLFTEQKAVVYRGEKYLCLYTPEDGEYNFESDGKKTFTDLFTGRQITFPTALPKFKCFLFQK